MGQFFNFSHHVVSDAFGRRAFLRAWWRKAERDRRWIPPAYEPMQRALVRRAEPHIARFAPLLLELNAVERPRRSGSKAGVIDGPLSMAAGDVRVGQAALLFDAAFDTAHLALLEVANDDEALGRLLEVSAAQAMEAGCARLLLTTGLAPAFATGVLCSHFNLPPPLHSAYNAPFLPELLEADCEALLPRRIWHAPVAPETGEPELPQGLQIELVGAERLAGDLAPLVIELWQQGAAAEAGLRPPDALEIAFLLAQWRVAPLTLLLATWQGEPAGFALLQPDVGPALRRLRGGYALWARLWLAQRPPQTAPSGRLLLGGVAARAAGQDIGAALWRRCQAHARSQGWSALAVGPVDEGDPLEEFLAARGGEPRQRSVLFAYGDAGGGAMEPMDFAW